MHNNALGPEICGKPNNGNNDFYRVTYVDARGAAGRPAAMLAVRPKRGGAVRSLQGSHGAAARNPAERVPKITKLSEEIIIEVGPRLWDGEDEKQLIGLKIRIPRAPMRVRSATSIQGVSG